MSSWFSPTEYIPRISQIDYEALKADGVHGVIVDLDNTLLGYRALEPDPADAAWVSGAAEYGVRIIMVTNNATPRARQIATTLAIPIVANARKPFGRGFRQALQVLDLPRESVVVVGDQVFTDVLGAKLFGLRVILVDPLVKGDPWTTYPLRLIERWLLRDLPRTESHLTQRPDRKAKRCG